MYKKLINALNIMITSLIGVFIGSGIYVYWDYTKHPKIYMMQSTPWYTSILVSGIFTTVVVVLIIIIKIIIKQIIKKKEISNY